MRQRPAGLERSWQRGVGRALLAVQVIGTLLLVAILATAPRVSAAGGQAEIASEGPLTRVIISGDLNCQVAHEADQSLEFFGGELGACGTFLSFGDTLYGPADVPSGGGGATGWTPVSQVPVAGSGSGSDPFRIVTTVEAADTGMRIEQTDSYVIGDESYRTDVRIVNGTGSEQRVVLFRAADCYLQDSDVGFGRVDNGSPACVISQESDARIEQWVPISPGSAHYEGSYSTMWQLVAEQEPFPNTCQCDTSVDNGAGLSWEATVAGSESVTLSHLTFFSPEGRRAGTPIRDAVPGPNEINLDPVVVASSVALAAGVVFIVPFPAALFNSTLEENYAEVTGWWRRLGGRVSRSANRGARWAGSRIQNARRGQPDPASTAQQIAAEPTVEPAATMAEEPTAFWRTPAGIVTFIGLSALLYSLLDPTFGFSIDSLGTLIGLALGLLLTLAVYAIPLFLLGRGRGGGMVAQALPGTLFIAAICVILSRVANFQPGYLYGLIIGFGFARELSKVAEGRLVGIATATSLGASIVAWLVLPAVRDGGGVDLTGIILETALATVVVAGLEGALFGMLPLRFLPGERVRAWNSRFWMGLVGVAAFAFFHILMNPSAGYLADTERTSMATVVGLLLVFGVGSVLFWAYFRFLHRRPAGALSPASAPAGGSGDRFEAGGEVAQGGRLLDDPHAAQVGGTLGDPADDLDDEVDMRLGVDPAGDGEPDELHRGG